MNSKHFAQLGIGLLGVWALIGAVNGFTNILLTAASVQEVDRTLLYAAGLPVVALFALSYVLFFHSGQLAAMIAPDASPASAPSEDLSTILVVLTGVLLLVEGAPGAISLLFSTMAARGLGGDAQAVLMRRLVSVAAQIGAALFLIVRPGRLLDFVYRQPSADVVPSDTTP